MCIFARELDAVLTRQGLHLGSLYRVQVGDGRIHPLQVQRLKRAAAGDCSRSVTLNPDELDATIQMFAFGANDERRLRAALLAESIFRFLLDRIDQDSALSNAERLFDTLVSSNTARLVEWQRTALDEIRNDPEDEDPSPESRAWEVEHDLEPALDLYDEALLWLRHARDARDQERRHGYATLAASLLTAADDLLRYPTGILEGTQELAACREVVATALEVAARQVADNLA